MSASRLLVVEDNPTELLILSGCLKRVGFQVSYARNAAEVWPILKHQEIDLVLLDLGLPDADGFAVASRIYAETRVPLMFVTANSAEEAQVRGIGVGALDYVTKPYVPEVIVVRVRNILARIPAQVGHRPLRFGPYLLDLERRCLSREDREIALNQSEYAALAALAEAHGRALSRSQVLDLRGIEGEATMRSVDVLMARLRQKIEPDTAHPRYIKTVPGVGYRLDGLES